MRRRLFQCKANINNPYTLAAYLLRTAVLYMHHLAIHPTEISSPPATLAQRVTLLAC
jgi:hypothetical protein